MGAVRVSANRQQASIFWHSENGDIVNGYYQCDGETGILVSQGEYVISQTANIPSSDIHPNTGLAVELLGSTAGYRVFYHDKDSQVHSLSYTNKINWNYYGAVSQDPTFGMALASAHSSDNNITVVFPKSAKDIEVSRLNEDGTYHICMSNPLSFLSCLECLDVSLVGSAYECFNVSTSHKPPTQLYT